MSANLSDETDAAPPSPRKVGWLMSRPWAAVSLLLLIGIFNYLDRALPSILNEPIKRDLGLSDTTLGLINGIGFLLVFAAASVPIASLSDRGRYNIVISSCLAIWSLMTMLGGLVVTGWQLALSRMGVALGEAGGMPAAHAFITRHFPTERRAGALSVFMLCVPFGSMSGFILGGLLGQQLGWRMTFVLLGAVGLALAAFSYVGLGSASGSEQTEAKADPIPVLPQLRNASLVATLAGSSFITIGGYAIAAFGPAFLMRTHAMTVSDAGVKFGIAAGLGGAATLVITGWIADKLSKRDPRWLLGAAMTMILLGLPLSIASFRVENQNLAVVLLAVNYVIPTAYTAPVIAALHRLCPVGFRARASALLLFCSGVFGGAGPLLVGAISDTLQPAYAEKALGHAMLITIPSAFGLAVIFYGIALINFRRDLAKDE